MTLDPAIESSSVSPDGARTPAGTPALEYRCVSVRQTQSSSTEPHNNASCADDTDGNKRFEPLSRASVIRGLACYGLVVGYSLLALVLLLLLTYLSFFAAKMDDGSGAAPEFIGCRSWAFGDSCGLWGIDCRPFETEWSAFRCPTKCSLGACRVVTRVCVDARAWTTRRAAPR